MLKDRMLSSSLIDNKARSRLINSLKEDIKQDDSLINNFFFDREDFKDRIYLILSKKVQDMYPYQSYRIDDEIINMSLAEIFGLGILEKYLQDEKVTDIFVQDKELVIIRDGEKQHLGEVFNTMEEVFLIIDRIKKHTGKTIDQRIPFLNSELYDGSRCSVVIPPASDKVYISIRVFNCRDFNLEDLFRLEMFDRNKYDLLTKLVQEQKNILIAGAMGSGKTTLLNTLARLIPKNEFISVIQDVPEIRLREHPYVRQLCTRPKSREIDNEITHGKLLFETLRMKADRIILGEVRNAMGAYHMLQALNTGHKGSFGTIHADSALDSLLRLETLVMEYKENIGNHIAKRMISKAIDVVVYLDLVKDSDFNISSRKLKEIIIVHDELDSKGGYRLERL